MRNNSGGGNLRGPSNDAAGLLTIDQAAAYLGITEDQVAGFVQDGELSYINVGRGKKRARYRFTIPDLQAFIEHRRRREVSCRSTNPKGHRITTSTFRSEVIGFMAARAAQLAGKPKPSMVERNKAKVLAKAMQRSRTSLLIDDVAARLWNERAQHDAAAEATSANLARLVEYFGKTRSLTNIDHSAASKMVAWRRGHHVKGRSDAPLISNGTVNRSTVTVLQRLFAFAKSEGATFEHEPKWSELYLPEPAERVRELQDDEAVAIEAAIRDDYVPFFDFVRASGLRQPNASRCDGRKSILAPGRLYASARAAGELYSQSPPASGKSCFRYKASIPTSSSLMPPPTTPWDGCAGSVIHSRSAGPDQHGGGYEPGPACRISASTISGMTSAPSCCAIPAISSWCRRP